MFLCENQNVVCYVGFLAVKKKVKEKLATIAALRPAACVLAAAA